MSSGEVTLRLEPLKAVTKQGETIGMKLVFMGGAHETTLVLPRAADPSGLLAYRLTEITSGQEWTAARHDVRSYAADSRQPLAAGGRIEVVHDALTFERPDVTYEPELPAGTYRIVATYDEGKAIRPENRTSRVLHSAPVQIVVTSPP